MQLFLDRFETRFGDVLTAVRASGALVRLEFLGRAAERLEHIQRELARRGHALGWRAAPGERVRTQVQAFLAGERRDFELELAPQGTPFQQAVWRALLCIPYGETRSYGELARELGRPRAVRAVGRANGQNPIALVVPCHRVIGADGSLTGYGGGLELKGALLALEQGAAV